MTLETTKDCVSTKCFFVPSNVVKSFAAMAFASIKPEDNVMQEPPRKNNDFIIKKDMFRQMLITSALFVAVLIGMLNIPIEGYELNTKAFSALFFTTFVMMQFANMFIVRGYHYCRAKGESIKNLYPTTFLLVAVMIFIGQIAITQFGGEAFRVEPLNITTWLILAGTAFVAIAIDFVIKLARK